MIFMSTCVIPPVHVARMASFTAETKAQLSTCWESDLYWTLYPTKVKEAHV